MPRWLPRIGFDALSRAEVMQLGLHPGRNWRGLYVEWFDRGAIIFAVPVSA